MYHEPDDIISPFLSPDLLSQQEGRRIVSGRFFRPLELRLNIPSRLIGVGELGMFLAERTPANGNRSFDAIQGLNWLPHPAVRTGHQVEGNC